jgi:hypothetical protein
MKDSLKNNDCLYFINKYFQWLYYQLFFFVLCVILLYLFFSILQKNRSNARGIQLVD